MNETIPDDDDYMVVLAPQLLDAYRRTGRQGDLIAAVMASNQVLNWHLGVIPSSSDQKAFAEEFPTWHVIHEVAEGRRMFEAGVLAEEPCVLLREEADKPGETAETVLAMRCVDFLDDFRRRYLDPDAAVVSRDRKQSPRPTAGNK